MTIHETHKHTFAVADLGDTDNDHDRGNDSLNTATAQQSNAALHAYHNAMPTVDHPSVAATSAPAPAAHPRADRNPQRANDRPLGRQGIYIISSP